jgi:signal transduction histidine kinase
MTSRPDGRVPQLAGPVVVSGLGVTLAAVALWNFSRELRQLESPWFPVAALVLSGGLSVALVALGVRLRRESPRAADQWRIARWCLLGAALLAGVWLLTIAIRLAEGRAVGEPALALVVSAASGGIVGTAVGTLYVRVDRERTRASRARDTLGFMNHALRHDVANGVTVIEGHAELLEGTLDGDEGVERHIDAITTRTEDLDGLVEDLRPLARAAAGEDTVEAVPLSAVVTDAVTTARQSFPDSDLSVDVPSDVAVRGNDTLARVFENVVSNAVEHNDSDTPRVRLTADVGPETATVRVADDGPGVPPAEREAIFEYDGGAHGFGLHLVRTLVERFDGRVYVEDSDLGGAAVVVELPLAGSERNF